MSISQEDLRSEISLLSDPVNEYRAGRRWMMSSARESGLALLALAPTSLLWGVQIRRGYYLNLFEQGTVFAGGWQVMNGKTLYKDVFAFYGPLTYLMPVTSGHLVGGGAVRIIALDVAVALVTALVSYWLARRLSGRVHLALLVPVAIALMGAAGVRVVLPLASLYVLAEAIHRRSRKLILASGLLAGLALMWMQDGGVAVVAAVTAACILSWSTRTLRRTTVGRQSASTRRTRGASAAVAWVWHGGVLLACAPFLVAFSREGIVRDWFYYCFIFPNTKYTERSSTGYVMELLNEWRGIDPIRYAYKFTFYIGPYIFCLSAASLVLFVALRAVWCTNGDGRVFVTAAVAIYSALQLRVLLASLDEAKLASVVAPVLVGTFITAARCWDGTEFQRRQGPHRWLAGVLIGIWVAIGLVGLQKQVHNFLHTGTATVQYGRQGLAGVPMANASPPESSVADVESLVAFIQAKVRPSESILVLPDQPMLYYLAERNNVARFDYLDPVYIGPDEDRVIAQAVAERQPAMVVLAGSTFAGSSLTGPQMAPVTYCVVRAGYRMERHFGPFAVWVPVGNPQTRPAVAQCLRVL